MLKKTLDIQYSLSLFELTNFLKDTPNFNIRFSKTLTLSNADTCNPLLYSYSNDQFFPIDDQGWGNSGYSDDGVAHNYAFTLTFSGRFTYTQNQTIFTFTGDDDVFVYINDRLAMDLGGVHPAETGTIDLTYPEGGKGIVVRSTLYLEGCTPENNGTLPCATRDGPTSSGYCACALGLVPNGVYNFDMFYTERHTTGSDLAFTTSIEIDCPT
jgi:fibro-slime domain-containing protein